MDLWVFGKRGREEVLFYIYGVRYVCGGGCGKWNDLIVFNYFGVLMIISHCVLLTITFKWIDMLSFVVFQWNRDHLSCFLLLWWSSLTLTHPLFLHFALPVFLHAYCATSCTCTMRTLFYMNIQSMVLPQSAEQSGWVSLCVFSCVFSNTKILLAFAQQRHSRNIS